MDGSRPAGEFPAVDRRSTRRESLSGAPPEEVAAQGRRRRLRDRLESDEGVALSAALGRQPELRNPLLLCDDDLRQTAMHIEGIEAFLLQAVRLLEKPDLKAGEMKALLSEDVEARLDALGGTLESLRRSLRTIAGRL